MTAIQELKPPRGASIKGPDLNKKILVVDDESAILQTLRFNLERSGYAVVTAGDGRTAIAMAQREQPDLIVLDIMLPVLDGVEACKEIRKFSPVPIIMLTAKDQEIDKVLALELGADDYVTKPFALHEFLARVKARLRRQNSVRSGTRRGDRSRRDRSRPIAPAAHGSREGRGARAQGVRAASRAHGESRSRRHPANAAR